MITTTLPSSRVRVYLPQEFKITVWSKLKPYYNELLKRPIQSIQDLENWIVDSSELDALYEEDLHRRYISMITNPDDDRALAAYEYVSKEITPQIESIKHLLNKKFLEEPLSKKLSKINFKTYHRSVKMQTAIFHKENLFLQQEIENLCKTYSNCIAGFQMTFQTKDYNLKQAQLLLRSTDRNTHKTAYNKLSTFYSQNAPLLNSIFDGLTQMRKQLARNAGFNNYRDYKFKALGRFDYTAEDCHELHESIADAVGPLLEQLYFDRKQVLNTEELHFWDLQFSFQQQELNFFEPNSKQLIQKTIDCFTNIHPSFGECIQKINDLKHINIAPTNGSTSFASCVPLSLSAAPFIFMVPRGSSQDSSTFIQLCGQAVHLSLANHHNIHTHRQIPIELIKLSARFFEILIIENGIEFFDSKEQAYRAKQYFIESILHALSSFALLDRFQHWIYKNSKHTEEERKQSWLYMQARFNSNLIADENVEDSKWYSWHQHHQLFLQPFSSIEDGIALLGAISLWKKYSESPEQTIENYKTAMEFGNTINLKEIYHKAGISLDFSKEYVASLITFAQSELKKPDL